MICEKCKKDFSDVKWKSGETYEGLDRHHNPPEFISEYLNESWSGEFYDLCRKDHRELHDELLKILNEIAGTLKFLNSEYWVCKKMSPQQKEESKKKMYEFTKEWIIKKEGEDVTRND